MMSQWSATLGKLTGYAALVAVVSLPAAAAAKGTVVKTIDAKRTATAREIVIQTEGTPKFSVFRLAEPFRVLVDIENATVPEALGLLEYADDPVIRYVSAKTFREDNSSVVRVEIGLDKRHTYDVQAVGSSIVAKIDVPAGAGELPHTTPAGILAPQKPAKLGRLTKKVNGQTVLITAPLSGGTPKAEAVSIVELANPSRVVIDIAGAAAYPKFQKLKVNKHNIRRARMATSEDGVRIVVDLKKGADLPDVNVDALNGNLQVSVAPAVAKAQPATVKPTETPQPAVVTKPVETKVAKAKQSKKAFQQAAITDVRFEPKNGFLRLTLDLDKDASVAKDAASTRAMPLLRVNNAKLPESFVRTLDTSAVAGRVVQSISTYNDGHDTIIAASVGGDTEHRHWRKGNRLIWDFRAKNSQPTTASATPKTGARVIEYPEQATSGFESTATSLTSLSTAQRQRYRGRRISLDLKDADIHNVLRLLADVSKLNIVAADDVGGKITLKLRNVPWDQALDIILQAKKLDKTRNGNIIRVAPIEVLEREEQLRLSRREAQQKLEPMSVRLIPVNYAQASQIQKQVQELLSLRGKANVDARTNVLVVEDVAEVLLKVERLVRTLDTQTPQVLIEARIVEAATNFARDLGIQWGGTAAAAPQFGTQTGLQFPGTIRVGGGGDDQQTPTGGVLQTDNLFAVNLPAAVGTGAGGAIGFLFGSAGGSSLLALRLSAAETQGKTKIISAPKIVTLDNTEAKILTGEKIPITVITANGPTTRFVDANLELTVTPHVTADGSILMGIDAKKNELSQRQDILGTPGIITREAKTEMLVRDGDTAVLGGIYRRTAFEQKNYIPWIGQIPVLGWLFKKSNRSDSREELLIFISPRIVNRSQALVTGR